MSLILDALRKSEAERRRGQAPDLHSPSPLLMRAPPRRRSAWPVVFAGIAMLGLAAAAWWWLPPRQADAPSDVTPAAGRPSMDAETTIDTPPAPALTPIPSPVAAAPPPPRIQEPVPAPTLPEPDVIQPAAVGPAGQTPPIAVASAAAAVSAEPADPDLPTLSALSSAQRAAMPPLKMSMHVWAELPADRFVIIDGQRVGEGSRLPGAVVAQIRRDGVVLDVDGRLYLLPRP
jgi:general secretion pathway protein B